MLLKEQGRNVYIHWIFSLDILRKERKKWSTGSTGRRTFKENEIIAEWKKKWRFFLFVCFIFWSEEGKWDHIEEVESKIFEKNEAKRETRRQNGQHNFHCGCLRSRPSTTQKAIRQIQHNNVRLNMENWTETQIVTQGRRCNMYAWEIRSRKLSFNSLNPELLGLSAPWRKIRPLG